MAYTMIKDRKQVLHGNNPGTCAVRLPIAHGIPRGCMVAHSHRSTHGRGKFLCRMGRASGSTYFSHDSAMIGWQKEG